MTESRTPAPTPVKARSRRAGRKNAAAKPAQAEPLVAKPAPGTERPEAGSIASATLARATSTAVDRGEMIATAAYFRAVHRRFEPGHELEDWILAEREIDALLSATHGVQQ